MNPVTTPPRLQGQKRGASIPGRNGVEGGDIDPPLGANGVVDWIRQRNGCTRKLDACGEVDKVLVDEMHALEEDNEGKTGQCEGNGIQNREEDTDDAIPA